MSILHIKLITEYTNNYRDMAIFKKTDIKLFLNKLKHISIFERQQSKNLMKNQPLESIFIILGLNNRKYESQKSMIHDYTSRSTHRRKLRIMEQTTQFKRRKY